MRSKTKPKLKKQTSSKSEKPSAKKRLAALLDAPPTTKKPKAPMPPPTKPYDYFDAWDRVLQNATRTRDGFMKARREELQKFLDGLRLKEMTGEQLLRAHANFLKMAGSDSDPEVRTMFEPALARIQRFIIRRLDKNRVSEKV